MFSCDERIVFAGLSPCYLAGFGRHEEGVIVETWQSVFAQEGVDGSRMSTLTTAKCVELSAELGQKWRADLARLVEDPMNVACELTLELLSTACLVSKDATELLCKDSEFLDLLATFSPARTLTASLTASQTTATSASTRGHARVITWVAGAQSEFA